MKILLATSWDTPCGIADHSAQAMEAIYTADPSLHFTPSAEALDPAWVWSHTPEEIGDVLWLNYHRGLHSRWGADQVANFKREYKRPVVITFHDTYGEREPDQLTRDLHDLADAFIVHEPCLGLPRAHLIRQGVQDWAGVYQYDTSLYGWTQGRPILGTVGFNFPWKNYDRLAKVTAEAGWAFLVLSNNASTLDVARWLSLNPHTQVHRGFLSTGDIVTRLGGCDATVFAYECANSGTSGAIRLGLAARKPVIAWSNCRQFRDLADDGEILWCGAFERLPYVLGNQVMIGRVDPGIVALAARDAWPVQAAKYAAIFREYAQ